MIGPTALRDERVLLADVARGSTEALGQVYDMYATTLNGRLLASGIPAAKTEDILMKVFLSFWTAAPRLTSRASIESQLMQITAAHAREALARTNDVSAALAS